MFKVTSEPEAGLCEAPQEAFLLTPFFFWKLLGMLKLEQNASSSPLCFRLLESDNCAARVSLVELFSIAIATYCLARQWEGEGVRGAVSGLRTKHCYPQSLSGFCPIGQRTQIKWGPRSGDKLSNSRSPEAVDYTDISSQTCRNLLLL